MKDYSTPYSRAIDSQGLRFPAILCQIRTEQGRQLRRQGVERFKFKFLTPRTDGISNTISTVAKDNYLMENHHLSDAGGLVYHQQPTKQDLIDYFGQRIRIRKLTKRECFRLMDLDDADIDKIDAYPFASAQERETYLEQADKQQIKEVKQDTIPKTAKLKMAGNSIVVACLYHIFKGLFIEPAKQQQPQQLSLF